MEVPGGLLVAVVALGWLVIWSGALRDAYRRPDAEWREAGESRTTWLLLIFVFQFFGLAAYLWWVQPKLDAARTSTTRRM